MWEWWHRDRAPGDSPARRFHGHPSMRGGLNGPRHNTYPKYVPNTLDISSVSGGQPSRQAAQLAGGRILHREQVRDEQPDQLMAAYLFRGDLLGLT
jgi:hypothetical protein